MSLHKICTAQSSQFKALPRNAFYIELLGTGGPYSLNYERLLSRQNIGGLRYGVGITLLPTYQGLTQRLTKLWGKGEHHAETGLGILVARQNDPEAFDFNNRNGYVIRIHLSPQVGYRYQKNTAGLLFRATYTPWINYYSGQVRFRNWAGISIGKMF